MKQINIRFLVFLFFIVTYVLITSSCSVHLIRELNESSNISHSDTTRKDVKIHMKDGSLYVLDSLIAHENADSVEGYGVYYDQYRDVIKSNLIQSGVSDSTKFHIPLSGVALLETNRIKGLKGKIATLALVAVPSIILTTYCIMNPKACFGSCPTFYSWNGYDTTLMAEGFSSSILRVFEKEDIDMLYHARNTSNCFHLQVKNEALETHIIKQASLIAIPRTDDERIFATDNGEFFKTTGIQKPFFCYAPEGNCLDKVLLMDHKERFSLSDQENLATRELVEVSFENVPEGELGVIIGCRQTLMTTYLFYQSLAYLGSSAGYFASRIESGDVSLKRKVDRMWDLLGGIELFVLNSEGKWKKVNETQEMGPISTDVHLIKIPETGTRDLRIRLRLTKGLWRINYLAVGKLERITQPRIIEPASVVNTGVSEGNAKSFRIDLDKPLVTMPGDVYDICYELADNSTDYEFFLKSRGYYLEWIRENWLAEENLRNAAIFFIFPRYYLRKNAEKFKMIEPTMEESFWNSKYARKN